MLRKILPAFLLVLGFSAKAQNACTTLGQNPSTAFPVCGLDTFKQSSVPTCGGKSIPVPGCSNAAYADVNPFWYKFTCYQTGTLGFTITPENLLDDYDWQLFDITGRDPNAVYTDQSLFVVGNWSGSYGVTGTSANNTNIVSCASNPVTENVTTFSKMPVITVGHTYLLLISHYSGSGQSGYGLSFGGGTGSIVDPLKPALVSASANCSGQTITIAVNKKMQCSSLASNGTDFAISPAVAKVTSASGINCGSSFDMDSLTINIDKPLPPGDYFIVVKKGSDLNTLLDNCNNSIPENDSIPFTIFPLAPTPMDSITPVQCAPDVLRLVFRKRMRCSSVASNGSDFKLSGNNIVASAFADSCSTDGLSNIIKVKLTKPIQTAGVVTITLKAGTDGNTLLDECAQETPAGSTVSFLTADTVSAIFNYKVDLGCVFDTLFYSHDGRNEVNTWSWIFDINGTGNSKDSFFTFNDYGTKHIKLFVSNGVCTDSSAADILLDNELISRLNVAPSTQLCPEDAATFTDSSTGKIVSWFWIFGDGTTSTLQDPPSKYYPSPPTNQGSTFPAALIVKNDIGCFDTSRATLKVFYNCYIAVPSAFTPNGDGLNDYLYPLNAYKADNLEFRVYNRWGQLVFETKDWTRKWNGTINGNPQAAGTYVWTLQYTHHDTGQHFSLKGTTVLIR